MCTIAWSDDLGLGIPDLDRADRAMISHVNRLNDAVRGRPSHADIAWLMERILHEATWHFAMEERIFLRCDYPHPRGHAALHAQIKAEFAHALEAFRSPRCAAAWVDNGLLVRQMLLDHLAQEGRTFRAIQAQGMSANPRPHR